MTDATCLDEKYSTTRLLTKEKPIIENRPEDKFETHLFLPKGEGRKGEGGLRTKGYFKKSYDDKPLVSIITVVFNGEKYLEQTIQSVIAQNYDNVEYIIIDGGSNDGTVDIIKKYEDKIDCWISERDEGIYDAMNKGIDVASGDWINFMNAGDGFYDSEILKKIFLNKDLENYDVIYGDVNNIYDSYSYIKKALRIDNIKYGMAFCHQSSFVSKKLYQQNKFNKHYSICADYNFFLNIYNYKYKFKQIPIIIANFQCDGISSNQEYKLLYEKYKILKSSRNLTIKTSIFLIIIMIKVFIKNSLPEQLVKK